MRGMRKTPEYCERVEEGLDFYRMPKGTNAGVRSIVVDLSEVIALCEGERRNTIRLYLRSGSTICVHGSKALEDEILSIVAEIRHELAYTSFINKNTI